MPSFQIGQAAELLGVSTDTVRRWVDAGRLKATRTSGGRRLVDGLDLAQFAVELSDDRRPATIVGASARNRFTGIITRVATDNIAAQVEIQAGAHRIVALLTREAVDELCLAPGMLAVAAVKATNVVVEVPGGG